MHFRLFGVDAGTVDQPRTFRHRMPVFVGGQRARFHQKAVVEPFRLLLRFPLFLFCRRLTGYIAGVYRQEDRFAAEDGRVFRERSEQGLALYGKDLGLGRDPRCRSRSKMLVSEYAAVLRYPHVSRDLFCMASKSGKAL
jgi:hypothetical protein